MLGSNVPTLGGIPNGFLYAQQWGCECIQIYVTPSRRWHVPALLSEDVSEFKLAWQTSQVKHVVAHVPFLVNLASPAKTKWQKSKNRLAIELDRASKFDVSSLVLHPGHYGNSGKDSGIKRIIEGLRAVLCDVDNSTTRILLETMAGQGTELGHRFEQIAYILEAVNAPERLGVCFDTCHVFAAGYDIRGYRGYETVLRKFDEIIGINNIGVFHLNDSKKGLDSRIDRHASIGEGCLGLEVFHAIVRDSRFLSIPKILEIPNRDERSQHDLKLLRRLQTSRSCSQSL